MLRSAATLVTRPLIAWSFVTGGVAALRTPGPLVGLSRKVGIPAPDLAVPVSSAAMAVAGTTMSLGIRPRASAVVLAGCLAGLTYTLHGYWREDAAVHVQKQQGAVPRRCHPPRLRGPAGMEDPRTAEAHSCWKT